MRFVFLPVFLLTSCCVIFVVSCCKENCSDENIFAIDFKGFSPGETDKIKIVTYTHNDFTFPADSYYVSNNNIITKDPTRVYPDKPLVADFDFRIVAERAGLVYTLSEIQTRKENCRCGSGTYKIITGYKINGVQYAGLNGNALVISR